MAGRFAALPERWQDASRRTPRENKKNLCGLSALGGESFLTAQVPSMSVSVGTNAGVAEIELMRQTAHAFILHQFRHIMPAYIRGKQP